MNYYTEEGSIIIVNGTNTLGGHLVMSRGGCLCHIAHIVEKLHWT